MTKEDLIKYKEKLSKLSKEEEKLRDVYLLKLAKGEIEGPMTGYPSIDKPNLQYYDDETIISDIPNKTISEYLNDVFLENENATCLEYYGNKISRKEFKKNKNKIRDKYAAMGVKKGDIVSIISVTTPEVIYSIYALNDLGAVANLIDPRLSIENLKEKCSKSNIIVSLDLIQEKLKQSVNEDQKVIYTSVSNSFLIILKKAYEMKNKTKIEHDNSISWEEFLKINSTKAKNVSYEANRPAIMVSTSGTTGPSKIAVLTNENVNSVAWQYAHSGIEHKLGDTFLNIMPAFLSYGAVAGIHMPLSLGFKTVVIPKREFEQMGKYIMKYKPQAYLDIPTGYENLMKSTEISSNKKLKFRIFKKNYEIDVSKKNDLSFIKSPGVGGDHLNNTLEHKMNVFLKDHNNQNLVAKGYGMTEVSSAAITNVSDKCNSLGSVGVALSKTIVKIINPETKEELPYNTEGELYLSTPALFQGYLNDEKSTNNEIEVDENGRKWIKTGDYFVMTSNGELFFKGRKKNMFVRPDGHNNHPMEMNELILKHKAVKDSYTVGVTSPYHFQGKYPKSVVVLKDEYKGKEEAVQKELEELCLSTFSQRDVPYYYEFKDSLPLTPGGKVDFILLEKEGVEKASKAQILIQERELEEKNRGRVMKTLSREKRPGKKSVNGYLTETL